MKKATFTGFVLLVLISICFATNDNLNSDNSQQSKEQRHFLLMGGLEDPLLESFINNYRNIDTYQATWSIEFNIDNGKFTKIEKIRTLIEMGIKKIRTLIEVAFDRKTNSLSYSAKSQKFLNNQWVEYNQPYGSKMLVVYNEGNLSVQTDMLTEVQATEKHYDDPNEFAYRDFRRAVWVSPIPFDLPLLASPMPIMEMLQARPEKLETIKLPANTVATPHIPEKQKTSRDNRELIADSDLRINIFPNVGETAVCLIIDGKDGLLNEWRYFRSDVKKDANPTILKLQSVKVNTPLDRSIFDFNMQKQKMFPPVPEGSTIASNLPQDLVNSWGNQKEFFIKEDFQILEWEAAKSELLKKNYRGGKQYHTGWLTIYMKDGRKYLTKQPQIDVFFDFMEESNLSTKGFGTE